MLLFAVNGSAGVCSDKTVTKSDAPPDAHADALSDKQADKPGDGQANERGSSGKWSLSKGKRLYGAAFKAIKDYDIALVDPAERFDWCRAWQHKHDHDTKLETEAGTDAAVREMLASLHQRYNQYQSPEETKNDKEEKAGTYKGIGCHISIEGIADILRNDFHVTQFSWNEEKGILMVPSSSEARDVELEEILQRIKQIPASSSHPALVTTVNPGSPAERAGLKQGDRIISIEGKSVDGEAIEEISNQMRGAVGSSMTMVVSRKGTDGKFAKSELVIKRALITHPVVQFKELEPSITYILLENFDSDFVVEQMADALKKASNDRGVILDLRNNLGGVTQWCWDIAAELLPQGLTSEETIRDKNNLVTARIILQPGCTVYTIRHSNQPTSLQLDHEDRQALALRPEIPIVVLVNEYTASCAELLAGCLQANHRALIVGSLTTGKGVGQKVVDLPFNRSIYVTNKEFLPGGSAINDIGVIPDVVVNQSPEETADNQLLLAHRELAQLIALRESRHKLKETARQSHGGGSKKLEALEKPGQDSEVAK
ncbi:MAG TPA: S41 family peptidase [Chroococcales cyanobacterium]